MNRSTIDYRLDRDWLVRWGRVYEYLQCESKMVAEPAPTEIMSTLSTINLQPLIEADKRR
ncbi:MAG: hypothetical protein HC786_03075 [Richelia sp. CSU_2_1]|nr:hypothetical protein [Richelia sp. CSU_2_1]